LYTIVDDVKLPCRVTHKKDSVGKVVLFDDLLNSEHYAEKDLKIIFKVFYREQADEFLNARIIELGCSNNKSNPCREYSEVFGFFDSQQLSEIFRRNVFVDRMNFLQAFNKALDEFLQIARRDSFYPSTREKMETLEFFRKRLLSRLVGIMFRHKINRISNDMIVVVNRFRKEYFFNLSKYVKGFICKKFEDYDLARLYANEYRISIAFRNHEFIENETVIINQSNNEIILKPKAETVSLFKQKMRDSLDYLAQGPGRSLGLINLFTSTNDIRDINEIVNSDWFSGIVTFKSEFLYAAKGTTSSIEELTSFYVKLLETVGSKEIFINIPDFRPENPVDIIEGEYTDLETYMKFNTVFNDNISAIAHASSNTGKVVNIVVPMIRLKDEMNSWKDNIIDIFSYLDSPIPLIGMMVETETTFEYFEDFKLHDFAIIGMDNLIDELMDNYDRYSDIDFEDFMLELGSDLRELHQHYRAHLSKTRHIVSGHCLKNPKILLRLMRSGFREFSIPVDHMPVSGEAVKFYADTRGNYIGVAAERKGKRLLKMQMDAEKEQKEKEEEEEKQEELRKIEERKKKYNIN
jgi:phosphoenolpyruvate-protein kinase (PTS system EI component)